MSKSKKKPPWFEIRDSSIQGRGAFALRPIPAGTRVIEYTGERISDKEADRRYDDEEMERHHTFLFAVEGHKTIDGAANGNDARFINHSCDPNCEAFEEEGRVFIYARIDIPEGDELFYDYRYQIEPDELDEEMRARYKCLCRTAQCRGTILEAIEEKKKSKDKKKKKKKSKDKDKDKKSKGKDKKKKKSKDKKKSKGKDKKKKSKDKKKKR